MVTVTSEPPPISIQPDRPVPPQDGPLTAILKGRLPRKIDNVSATYEVDGPEGKRCIDALDPKLLGDPTAVKTFRLMRSAQAFLVKEDPEGRLYAESPFGLPINDSRLSALTNESKPIDLDALETLDKPIDALGATLINKLVGKTDGSITELYEGTDGEGPIWIEVLDQFLADDEALRDAFNETRAKQAGVTVYERDNRAIAIYRARPATLNNAEILKTTYKGTLENAPSYEQGLREADEEAKAVFGGTRLSPIPRSETSYANKDEPISILDHDQLESELAENGFVTISAGTRLACRVGVSPNKW